MLSLEIETRITPSFMKLNSFSDSKSSVSLVKGIVTAITSLSLRSVSELTTSIPLTCFLLLLTPSTFIENPFAMRATLCPISPSPIIPSVFPYNSIPI